MSDPAFVSSNPFDWLQGGLFFGIGSGLANSGSSNHNNNNNNNNNSNSITNTDNCNSDIKATETNGCYETVESIESCNNTFLLLRGISESLQEIKSRKIIHSKNTDLRQPNGILSSGSFDTASSGNIVSVASTSSNDGKTSADEASKFIAARLSRLRFLLYDERRITSQQQQQQHYHHSQQQQQQQKSGGTSNYSSTNQNGGWRGPYSYIRDAKNDSYNTKLIYPVVAGDTIHVLTTGDLHNATNESHSTKTDTMNHTNSNGSDGYCSNCNKNLKELMPDLLESMILLPFESRKHVAAIFNYLIVCGLEGSDLELYRQIMNDFIKYIQTIFVHIMTILVTGHASPATDIGLHYGSLYRSIIRHPFLYKELVGSTSRTEQFVYPFLDKFVHVPNFEISSDAMETVRQVFNANTSSSSSSSQSSSVASSSGCGNGSSSSDEETSRIMGQIAAEFLTRDYIDIWDKRYNPKLLSDEVANYMTRRVALQILSTVLLTRSNYNVMIQYVANRNNLIIVMKLLRDTSPHITLDAFHVFKVFVANPNKPPDIVKILKDNQVKLCRYLRTLHQDREASDIQFRDEKALIIATIEEL